MSQPEQPRVFLARHGQTDYNLKGRFQGQQPVPLDDTGRAQARELAERAAGYGFAALWCSPLLARAKPLRRSSSGSASPPARTPA